jgi:hypothetical protein
VDINDTHRYELESCIGAFVVVTRLSYGDWLHRQEISADMTFNSSKDKKEDTATTIAMMQSRVAEWEFAQCIVEHNLEDENDKLLDFKNPRTLKTLQPKIGQEISKRISDLHDFEVGN